MKNEVTRRELAVVVKGTPEYVANVLQAYDQRGELLSSDDELRRGWSPAAGGEVFLRARLLMPVDKTAGRKAEQPGVAGSMALAATLVALCAGSAALMIALIVAVVRMAWSAVQPYLGAGAGLLLVLFVAWALLSSKRGHACRGLHCSGCRG